MRAIMLLTGVALICSACSSIPGKMNELHSGMPRTEAETLLGKPDRININPGNEIAYYNPVVAVGTYELFYVKYVDDKVESAGSLGRSGPSPGQMMMIQSSMQQQQMAQQQNYQLQQRILQPQPAMVNCTSNSLGATTYTNCH